jgi:hypothetical protein
MAYGRNPERGDGPVTLHGVIHSVARDLRGHYRPEHEIPHRLLTLLMQINEDDRRAKEPSGVPVIALEPAARRAARRPSSRRR